MTTAAGVETFAARRERYESERPGFSRNTAWVAAVIDTLRADPDHVGMPDAHITALEIDGTPVSLADFADLFKELTAVHQQLNSTITERDDARDAADRLAYAIAPAEVIGEHGTDDPWRNALDLLAATARGRRQLRDQRSNPPLDAAPATTATPHTRRDHAPVTETWTEQGTLSTGDEIGGDTQAGECYSRRFVNSDRPGAVVYVHFYVIGPNARGREIHAPFPRFAVHRAAEYTLCDDVEHPGDTEHWSDGVYAAGPEPDVFTDQDAAEAGARAMAEAFNARALAWDGQRFSDHRRHYPRR